jgi:hypothetical protein
MAIKYNRKTKEGEIECDDCEAKESFTSEDFCEMLEMASDVGWKSRKVANLFEHYCIDCKDKN